MQPMRKRPRGYEGKERAGEIAQSIKYLGGKKKGLRSPVVTSKAECDSLA